MMSMPRVRSVQSKKSIGRRVMIDEDGPRAVGAVNGIGVFAGSSFEDILRRASASTGDGHGPAYLSPFLLNASLPPQLLQRRLGLVEVVKTLFDKGFLSVHDFLPFEVVMDVSTTFLSSVFA